MTNLTNKNRFITAWKHRNRRLTNFCGRRMLAYHVPGTREAGTLAMYEAQAEDIFNPQEEAA